MKLQTKYLEEVDINEADTIYFKNGIPGFIEETKFVLLDLPDNPLFQILQSVKSQSVAFILTNPHQIYKNYAFEIDDNTVDSLGIESEHDVAILSIVTLGQSFEKSTLNLKAPIIINPNKKNGKQLILNIDELPTKAPIMPAKSADKGGN